jgi:ubiquinone biosynthesis protein
MPSSPLAQFSKNAPRFKEIVGTMLKYGVVNRIKENDPQFVKGLLKNSNGARITDMSPQTRLRMALTELGTTFIK